MTDCVEYAIEPRSGEPLWTTPFPDGACPFHAVITKGQVIATGFDFNFGVSAVPRVQARDGVPTGVTYLPDVLPQQFTPNFFNSNDSIAEGRGLVFVGGTKLTVLKAR